MTVALEFRRAVEECIRGFTAGGVLGGLLGAPTNALGATYPSPLVTGRLQRSQGANVASANDLTLGLDGDSFAITGTTTINRIDNTSWQPGSDLCLIFASALTVKAGIATGGAFTVLRLSGNVDFVAAAGATLTLRLLSTEWREVGRKA